mmetsp:Transcript_19408/g.64274  ORF Transcript_19408/g.64274 Transcript_19408/m.64274 type:complete len:122 (-) Transcript_19408:2194-2559(-)
MPPLILRDVAATASAKGTNGAQRVGQAADWADISMGGLNGTQSSIKHLYDQAAIEMEAIHYITLFQALFHFYKIYNPVQIQKIQVLQPHPESVLIVLAASPRVLQRQRRSSQPEVARDLRS